MPKELLDTQQTADYLRQARQTLAKWRVYGRGPAWVKIGRSVFYERAVLDAWIDRNTRSSTSGSPAKDAYRGGAEAPEESGSRTRADDTASGEGA